MAETMTLTTVLIDISTISTLLFVGFLIRQKIPFFYKYYIPTSFAFIGLILGSIPLVVKQANVKKVTLLHVLCMLVAFSFSLYLVAIDGNISSTLNSYNSNSYLILSGAITSAGIVIPGVSKTVLLMFLGIYEIYISAIATSCRRAL